MRALARIVALPVGLWCLLAGGTAFYRVVVNGWTQALLPGVAFVAVGVTLVYFTARNRFPWTVA